MEPDAQRLQLLIELRRYREAEVLLREYIGREPERGWWHSQMAFVLSQDDSRLLEALRSAEVGIGKDAEEPFAHLMLGIILHRLRKPRNALKALDETLRLNPFSTLAYTLKSSVLNDLGKNELALKAARDGLRIDPNDPDLLARKAWAEMALGRLTQATKSVQAGLEQEPAHANLLNTRGCVSMNRATETFNPLRRLHCHRKAERLFREALRIDPTEQAYAENRWNNSLSARAYSVRLGWYIAFVLWIAANQAVRLTYPFAADRKEIADDLSVALALMIMGFLLTTLLFGLSNFLTMLVPLGWLGLPRVPQPGRPPKAPKVPEPPPTTAAGQARAFLNGDIRWRSTTTLVVLLIVAFTILIFVMTASIN